MAGSECGNSLCVAISSKDGVLGIEESDLVAITIEIDGIADSLPIGLAGLSKKHLNTSSKT